MKMCEQILKKRQRPNTIQILRIVKNNLVPYKRICWLMIKVVK